jgi:alpha-tubulin suppressor-like RCC1 family protein
MESAGGACEARARYSRHLLQVTALPPITHVAASWFQACAVTTAGNAYCWGTPSDTSPASAGPCVGNPKCKPTPQLVPGVVQATGIAAGYGRACALTSGGEVVCWGWDKHGQLGRGDGVLPFEKKAVLVTMPAEPG